jgi:hypothetical protein
MSGAEPPDPRIEQLQKLRSELSADFSALNDETNELYLFHLDQLAQIHAKKLADLDVWAANERESATRYHGGQYYAIENDYEDRVRQVDSRVNDFLAFKIHLLREKFPDAAKYFEDRGYAWPVTESSPPPHQRPNLDIRPTDEPLLTAAEVDEDVAVVARLAAQPMTRFAVLGGLGPGSRAVLQFPRMPDVHGTIRAIGDDTFEFDADAGTVLNISFRAIELRHAAVSRE